MLGNMYWNFFFEINSYNMQLNLSITYIKLINEKLWRNLIFAVVKIDMKSGFSEIKLEWDFLLIFKDCEYLNIQS